ncbi:MAG TPA: hypothetical protein VEZ11_12865 [Thermoanaerobaculia bacterium]|nr:hypothetical protein [Thermoanaerobaculia bacterium]
MLRRALLSSVAAIFFSVVVQAATPQQPSATPNRVHPVRTGLDVAGFRAQLTARYGSNSDLRSLYVGSEICLMCHDGRWTKDMSQWRATQHAAAYVRPLASWTLLPGKGVLANSLGRPADDFLAGLDFNTVSSPFDSYKPNAPKLAVKNGIYTITIGQTAMPVVYALQWRGPSGAWEQLYCVRVPVSDSPTGKTGAVYSSPLFYTSDAGWEAYSPESWYDDNGQPRYGTASVTADVGANCESHDQNCVGCHATGVRSMTQNSRGEWIFKGFDATGYRSDDPSVFDYDGDGVFETMNVGCESCHGPGTLHILGNGDKAAIVNPAKLDAKSANDVCGQCHSVGASVPAGVFGWPYDESAGKSWFPGCGAPLQSYVQDAEVWWPDGKTGMDTSQYPELNKSTKTTNSFHTVRCIDCHNSMAPTSNNAQVVDSITSGTITIATQTTNNTLCLACHATHAPFDGITTAQVADYANQSRQIGSVVSDHTHHPYAAERLMGLSRCTGCHMALTQGPDAGLALHGHTFEAISPQKTLQYQDAGGMPNSCALSCHADRVNVFDIGMTSDLHTWNKPFDVTLAQLLQKYYGPDGIWWKMDVGPQVTMPSARSNSMSAQRSHGSRAVHHRVPHK